MLKVVSRNGLYYNYFSECFKFEKVLVGLPETFNIDPRVTSEKGKYISHLCTYKIYQTAQFNLLVL